MNIKIIAVLLAFITIDCAGMHRPLRSQKVITSTRGMKKLTATEKLQEFINYPNIETNQRDRFLKTVNEYIDAGANPNIRTTYEYQRPLLSMVIVSFYGNTNYSVDYQVRIIQKLIDLGADVNAADNLGQTPLTRAASSNSPYLVELLLSNGADPNSKTNQGHTAFDVAKITGSRAAARVLEQYRSKVKIP